METRHELESYIKLKLNLKHPSHEDCYAYGYEAALNEKSESDNPFKEGTVKYSKWQDGWWDGFYGEKPLFELFDADESVNANAANDEEYKEKVSFMAKVVKITGAIAATAFLGYQVIDLVA